MNLKVFFSVFFAVCLLISFLWAAVQITAYDKNFYLEQYEKNNTYETVGISREDLSRVTDSIIAYLKRDSDELNLSVQINGQTRDFFNEKELTHMADVQDLFRAFRSLRIFCATTILIAFVYLVRENGGLILAKATVAVFIGFIVLAGVLAAVIASDFNRYFTVFHEIFFSNDLWILDPTVDLLINIVPLPFFMSIALYTAAVFGAFSVLTIAVCLAGLWLKGGLHGPSSDDPSDIVTDY